MSSAGSNRQYALSVDRLPVANIDSPGSELGVIDGTYGEGNGWVVAYNGTEYTNYQWDGGFHLVDDPRILAGSSGYWLARGGKYLAEDAIPLGGSGVLAVLVADIDDPSAELNLIAATAEADLILAYQDIDEGPNEYTMYAWDGSPAHSALTSAYGDQGSAAQEEDIPYTVDGDGGRWVAIAGKYNKFPHYHSLLVDANGNVTVQSKDDIAGAVNYVTVQAAQAGYAATVSADGSDSSIGLLFQAKGDSKYVQFWGGSSQYKGARFVLYGRDHSTTPGKAYLDFGGYDSVGQIIFRHRLTSSFLTVFTLNYDGKLTLVEDINTAAGKKYLVNGAQHTHIAEDITDLSLQVYQAVELSGGTFDADAGINFETVRLTSGVGEVNLTDIGKNEGSNLITVWGNAYPPFDYDVLLSSGPNIMAAVLASGEAVVESFSGAVGYFTLTAGKSYKLTVNASNASAGQMPSIYLKYSAGTYPDFAPASMVEGEAVYNFVASITDAECYLYIYNSAACDWSATFTLYEQRDGLVKVLVMGDDNITLVHDEDKMLLNDAGDSIGEMRMTTGDIMAFVSSGGVWRELFRSIF